MREAQAWAQTASLWVYSGGVLRGSAVPAWSRGVGAAGGNVKTQLDRILFAFCRLARLMRFGLDDDDKDPFEYEAEADAKKAAAKKAGGGSKTVGMKPTKQTSMIGLDDDDDDKDPFEYQAEADAKKAAAKKAGGGSKTVGKKPTKQTSMNAFVGKKKAAAVEEEEEEDDDDEALLGGGFKKPPPSKGPKITSAFAENSESKQKVDRRVVPNARLPKSLADQLPEDWTARQYSYDKEKDRVWIFSHPIHGEYRSLELVKKKLEKLGKLAATEAGSSSSTDCSSKRRPSGGVSAENGDGEESAAQEESSRRTSLGGGSDDLAALLGNKRKREEEEQHMEERVREELEQQMDTGIRVNPLLAKLYCGR